MFELRPYQQTLVNRTKQAMINGYKSPCIVAPPGAGKTVIIADIAKSATDKKSHVLFLVHRMEILQQVEQTFIDFNVDMEYVELGMVQTVVRRLEETKKPSLIITD